jgi:radical SAM protein (TIGR01212 family)
MKNPYIYSNNNKRYYTQNFFLKETFGQKVIKLSLNAGFSCPNRDGKRGTNGCIFCSESHSGDFTPNKNLSITEQLKIQKQNLSTKWGEHLYIPYFQAGTNTYAPLEHLKKIFDEALLFENTVGIAISTRPDCIDETLVKYLFELSKETYLTIELGLQSIHDKTLKSINRGHNYADFLKAYTLLSNYNINTCIHIINGLPEEDYTMMMQTAYEISRLNPHSIKIHMLHIIKNTMLAKKYIENPFNLLSLEEYVNLVCDQLEVFPEKTIIQRLTGDGNKDTLIAPTWTLKKFVVLNEIDKELARRSSYQSNKKSLIFSHIV